MGYKTPEFHLVTADGREVYYQKDDKLLMAYDKANIRFDVVEEAIIKKGQPATFPIEFMRKEFALCALPADIKAENEVDWRCNFKIYAGSNKYVDFGIQEDYSQRYSTSHYPWSNIYYNRDDKTPPKFYYTAVNESKIEIDEKTCRTICSKANKYNYYLGLYDYSFPVNGVGVSFNILSRIIGVDAVVTLESMLRACAKDEKDPKIWNKYTVSWDNKGTKLLGVVDSLTENGASVVLPDGNKKIVAYAKLKREAAIKDESYKQILPETVSKNFDDAIKNLKLYRSKIEKRKVEVPMFSGHVHEARCAHCPNCDMLLVDEYRDTFVCAMCNQRATLIEEQGGIGLFAMADKPNKNQFAVEEAACCNNCALFHFEHGRQGKRSTGYCRFSNQCVVAHNWCKKWMPMQPERYTATLKQHCTNLGFGLKDSRNIKRRDKEIEDMVYREEDHEKQKQKATQMRGAYSVQYGKFHEALLEEANKLPIAEV